MTLISTFQAIKTGCGLSNVYIGHPLYPGPEFTGQFTTYKLLIVSQPQTSYCSIMAHFNSLGQIGVESQCTQFVLSSFLPSNNE